MKAGEIIDRVMTGEQLLQEMPVHYPGGIHYKNDAKFTPISLGNFKSYRILHIDTTFTYVVSPGLSYGFVFLNSDVQNPSPKGLVPVMTAELRNSGIDGLKQVHHLRIRKDFARRNVATTWYLKYVDAVGGIVSDSEHLTGGKVLWRSFVNSNHGYNVELYDTTTGHRTPVGPHTPDEDIWSVHKKDPSKAHLVLVLTKDSRSF